MKQFLVAACAAGAVLTGGAQAQDLPQSVVQPYLAYQQALDRGDMAAALAAARQAYEAGDAENVPRDTMGLLAENYATVASEAGQYELARDTWRESARIGDRERIEPIERAWRWHNAARNALLAEDTGDARRCSRVAAQLLYDAGPLAGDDRAFAAEAYVFAARMSMRVGNARGMRDPAVAALDILKATGAQPDITYAYLHYMAGISQMVWGNNYEAGYHLSMAAYMSADIEAMEDIERASDALYLLTWSRNEEAGDRPSELLDADPIYQAYYADNEEDTDPPGFVDAEPLDREDVEYPDDALRRGYEGVVVVGFSVDETGHVVDPRIVTAIPPDYFEDAVMDAISEWTYTPATQDGVPVRRDDMSVGFSFHLAG